MFFIYREVAYPHPLEIKEIRKKAYWRWFA